MLRFRVIDLFELETSFILLQCAEFFVVAGCSISPADLRKKKDRMIIETEEVVRLLPEIGSRDHKSRDRWKCRWRIPCAARNLV